MSLVWQYSINSQIEYYTKFVEVVHTLSNIFYEEIDEKEACKDANSSTCLSYRKLIESTDKMEASVVGLEEELRKWREGLKFGSFLLSLAGATIALIGAFWELHRKTVKEIEEEA